ncbi:MAG TPA: hypothetical protein VGT41_05425 [Candidatus Babeliales bacterium]|nr:hypothetical protein [Candidatus Babeliales bacterium]
MLTHLKQLKNNLLHNAFIKLCSCIIGYGIWSTLSNWYPIDISLSVPLCFYGSDKTITAPETIQVLLRGKRTTIATIDQTTIALHINGDSLHAGPNQITVENNNLFLPSNIHVVSYKPANLTIFVANNTPITEGLTQQL